MSDFTEPISVVEDLDPEPPPKHGISQRLEVILGLVLLVGVLTFVGWQWWHTQVQTSAYTAGEAALTDNDWDAALTNFTQAGDYKDAPQQAKSAQNQVDARNKLYTSAQQHITSTEWLAALIDVRAAALIQPGYEKLSLWEELARQSVYSDALSGTVAMRPNANPPGLYMRNARTWVYLHGSDSQSRLEERPHDGQLVFDAADASGKRHLVSAVLVGDEFEYTPLNIEPESVVQCVSTADGVWVTLNDRNYAVFPNQEQPVIRNSYNGFMVAYEPYTSSITYTIAPPPSFTYTTGNDVILAFGTQGRYLIAYYTGSATSGVMTRTSVNVYAGTAGNPTKELIYTQAGGGIQSAQLSPDGRYALITTFRLLPNTSEEQAIILVDLQNSAAPSPIVVRNITVPNGPVGEVRDGLNSIFVQSGVFAGDLLISQYNGDHTNIDLLDIAKISNTEANPLQSVTVQDPDNMQWLIAEQDANGIVLAGHNDVPDALPALTTATQTIVAVIIPASGPTQVESKTNTSATSINSFRTADNKAIWGYTINQRNGAEISLGVSAIPITISNTNAMVPTLIFSQTYSITQSRSSLMPSVALGDNLLAYTTNRQLHVRTYDGTLDLSLETGVTFLYDKSILQNGIDALK